MRTTLFSFAALAAVAAASYAAQTRIWEHSGRADFEKGTLEKLSLRSDGRLSLAPLLKELLDSSSVYLWALAEDSKGNLYTGGGGPGSSSARLFRIEPSGKSTAYADLEGFEIQAIAVDQQDRVYAATSPDGKVYRISAPQKPEVFYEPGAKYIWAMAFGPTGDLFVATGDMGEIHRVSPAGETSVFFRTEETHVRSLAVDATGNVIAGTEPSGLIMRISPAGQGFVLHQSAKREITSVAVAPDGSIYAAGVGDKQAPGLLPPPAETVPVAPVPATTGGAAPNPALPGGAAQRVQPVAPQPVTGVRTTVTGGSEVYRIASDGFPRTVWSDTNEIVYSIAIDRDGRAVLGTGNNGRIYRLEDDNLHTLLLKVPPKQITSVRAARDGKLVSVTGNVGRVYQIGPDMEKQGAFEGEVLDAQYFSYWGKLRVRGAPQSGIRVEARSGNLDRPQRNWSEWSPVELSSDGGRINAPPGRFLQYRVTLNNSPAGQRPEVRQIDVAYMHKNVPPVLERIAATPPNYRFPPKPLSITSPQGLTLPPLTETKTPPPPRPASLAASVSMQYAKGFIGGRWLARDDNGDDLVFQVEIRGTNESEWRLLEKDLEDPYVSWDSTAFPDGEYRLRVTASDRLSNPPAQALSATLEGEPFLIDNTPPQVIGLTAARAGAGLRVQWKAVDARSLVQKAEYSFDGGEWTVVEPVTRLSDSLALEYDLELKDVPPGEHTVAVRLADSFDNQTVAKVVLR